MKNHRIVITPGEPAGIGPDLVVKLAQFNWPVELVVCSDEKILKERADLLGLPLTLLPYNIKKKPVVQRAGTLNLLPITLHSCVKLGVPSTKSSQYVIDTLARACDGCVNGEFSALVTGPVHKEIINKAGIVFTGHTEYLQKRTKSQKAVMMMATEIMRVALTTTHIPVKEIASIITMDLLRDVIAILHQDLRKKFRIHTPHILVCGLNPHAGEGGYIGKEEIDIIIPTLREMRKSGICLSGPFSADTIFQYKYLKNADVILAMYHDQCLPVIKYRGFDCGVNITLGLPFIRTSVNHGTALDLVGQKKANVNSFIEAINFAIKMIIKIQ